MRARSSGRFIVSFGLLGCSAMAMSQEVHFPKGEQIFRANCMVCHQENGVGLVGLAPPLTHNPGVYATVPEGRIHLAEMVLYGMFGPITVDGKQFNFKMPTFQALSDEDLASVLNYVAFDIAKTPPTTLPLSATDVAAQRTTPMTGQQVREHRISLLKGLGL